MAVNKSFGTLCSAIALLAFAPAALADTKTSLEVAAGAKVASNPYLVAGSSTGAVAATIEANPTVVTGDATSTLRFDSAVRYDRYLRRYGDDLSARSSLTFDKRFSERTELTIGGNFGTSMGGARDLFRPDLTQGSTPSTPLNPTSDVTVTGARFRQYNYGANARLAARVSARGQIVLGGNANFFESNGTFGQPFSQYVADAGYNHIINDRSQVGLQTAYSKIDFRGRTAGDAEVITPAVTGTFKLSSTFSISGNVGAAFSAIRQLNGTRARNTALSAQVSLCQQFARSTFCLSGNRAVQATSLGGASTVTTVALSNNWRLSERDTLNIAANYGQTDQPSASAAQFGANRTKLALATAVYSRRVTERLFLTVTPQIEKAWGQPIKRNANAAVMVGLRYRFGQ